LSLTLVTTSTLPRQQTDPVLVIVMVHLFGIFAY
jgi:hypothetical protein